MPISATCPKCKTYNTFPSYGFVTKCRDCAINITVSFEDMPDRDDVPHITDIFPEPDPIPE
jgi:hypothetical protein